MFWQKPHLFLKNLNLTKEQISIIINDIAKIKLNDNIQFFINNVTTIMDNLEYPGIRIHIDSKLNNLIIAIKIDISTGDVITPHEIEYTLIFHSATAEKAE